MLAYYVEWHMRARLKPMLFDDEFIDAAHATKPSAVAKTPRSTHAKAKDATGLAEDGIPVHSFRTLMQDLGTLAYNITSTRRSTRRPRSSSPPGPQRCRKSLLIARRQPRAYPVSGRPLSI